MVNWFHIDQAAFVSERAFCSTSEAGPLFPSEATQVDVGKLYKEPVRFMPRTFRNLTEVPAPGTCYFMNLSSQTRNSFSAVSEDR